MALLRVTERNQNKRNVLHDDLYHNASAMVSLFLFSSSLLNLSCPQGNRTMLKTRLNIVKKKPTILSNRVAKIGFQESQILFFLYKYWILCCNLNCGDFIFFEKLITDSKLFWMCVILYNNINQRCSVLFAFTTSSLHGHIVVSFRSWTWAVV